MCFGIIRFYGASLTPGGYLFNLWIFELNVRRTWRSIIEIHVADLVRTRKELLSVTAWTPRQHWFYSRLVKRWLRVVKHERITIRGGEMGWNRSTFCKDCSKQRQMLVSCIHLQTSSSSFHVACAFKHEALQNWNQQLLAALHLLRKKYFGNFVFSDTWYAYKAVFL